MGLPEAITWKELKDHFKSAGRVNYAEVLSDQGGASKGCGIVEFSRADEALKAITHLNNTELGGAVIHVREDREDAAGGGGGGGGHAAPAPRAPRDPHAALHPQLPRHRLRHRVCQGQRHPGRHRGGPGGGGGPGHVMLRRTSY